MSTASSSAKASKFESLVSKYKQDHTHPVNHVMHIGMGWPMVAAALLLLPFKPLWSLALFLGGYAIMFAGHFIFEKNTPTILKHPSTPFVMAWSVICGICGAAAKMVTGRSSR